MMSIYLRSSLTADLGLDFLQCAIQPYWYPSISTSGESETLNFESVYLRLHSSRGQL